MTNDPDKIKEIMKLVTSTVYLLDSQMIELDNLDMNLHVESFLKDYCQQQLFHKVSNMFKTEERWNGFWCNEQREHFASMIQLRLKGLGVWQRDTQSETRACD